MVKNEYIIKTDRLGVRLWRENDFDGFYKIMSSKLTHTYTGENAWSAEETKEMISWNINNTDLSSGYFNLPLILLDVNKVIGRVGLNPYLEEERIPEIEWTIGSDYWNKGYATEIGREILKYGIIKGNFNKIVGFTHPQNLGSIRVMQKIGMKYLEKKTFRDQEFLFYCFDRDDLD